MSNNSLLIAGRGSQIANTVMTLTVTGTGSAVGALSVITSQVTTLTLDGSGYFYTNAAGTVGQTQSFNTNAGTPTVLYIKVLSGTSKLKGFVANNLTRIYSWGASTNAPSLFMDVSAFPNLNYLNIPGNNTITGSVTNLTALTYLSAQGSNTLSGSITNLTNLTILNVDGSNTLNGSVTNLVNLTYLSVTGSNSITGSIASLTRLSVISIGGTNTNTLSGAVDSLINLTYMVITGNNTLSGSISNLTQLGTVSVTGANTVTGSINGLTSLTYLNLSGSNTVSGDASLLAGLQFLNISGNSTITVPNVTNLTGLCLIQLPSLVLTSANVNQILADMWANRDAAKARTDRTINLTGKAGSGAPTGKGLTNKANLQAYKSPNNTYSTAWTVTTR